MVGKIVDILIPTNKGYTVKKVSDKMIRRELEQFDNAFPNGVYAVPRNPKEPRVKVRALHEYCKAKGITPEELSEQEMNRFLSH
ncbi:hypothetical protein [Aneurinibacillus terranovensis]|uniref:hypothetical protein n=1 Tax=Aneurinibacillus terranovensis TaxID=278991 RepID=UPI001FDEC67C|nr:hypothetical protein [Aneurinibacillus terranovensis]